MPWAESESMLNHAVQQMYREPGTVVATARPIWGVYYSPYAAVAQSNENYGVDTEVPQPSFIVYDADAAAIRNGSQIDLRGERFTVVDSEPDSYGTTRLLFAGYG